jgi:hypothetical protein
MTLLSAITINVDQHLNARDYIFSGGLYIIHICLKAPFIASLQMASVHKFPALNTGRQGEFGAGF